MTENVSMVDHPPHYNHGRIETIDHIEDCIGTSGCIDFCIGNVIKYVFRARYKKEFLEDLQKAEWYINKAIDLYSNMMCETYQDEHEDDTYEHTYESEEDDA